MNDIITIVSGLPRSGTSLMMQMLEAGGMPVLTDEFRASDEDNPRGYYEFEPVKNTRSDTTWIDQAVGKAVKAIHILLPHLPYEYSYRIIFMNRDLEEVLQSQTVMLERSNKGGAKLSSEQLRVVFQSQLKSVMVWIETQSNCAVMNVEYGKLVSDPDYYLKEIGLFLDHQLDIEAMHKVIDPKLYRQRRDQHSSA